MGQKDYQKAPTSFDVARAAGVSQITVSRVFNEKWDGKISGRTRAKVLDAAMQLGYTKNEIARVLNLQRTGIVGLIRSNQRSIFYDCLADDLIHIFHENGIKTMVFEADVGDDINKVMMTAAGYQMDGIILTAVVLTQRLSSHVVNRQIPIVLINCMENVENCHRVYSDNWSGTAQMAEFLHRNGFQRYAYVSTGGSIYRNHEDRQMGFLETLAKFPDVQNVSVVEGDLSYESGLAAADALLNRPERPEVIFCANELMALGVMDAARNKYHLSVPDDLSVAGLEDSFMSSLGAYSLTALSQQPELLASTAADVMLQALQNSNLSLQAIPISQKLIVRNSVRISDKNV